MESLDVAAPLGRIGKLIAVGKNYADHAAEEGVAPPAEPLLFAKFPSAVIGHGDPIVWRRVRHDARSTGRPSSPS